MFHLFVVFVILYSVSSVYAFNFTVDGVLKLGPKLTYKYNIEVPSGDEEDPTDKYGVQQTRDIISGSRDVGSSEGVSEEIETTTEDVTAEKIYSKASNRQAGKQSHEENHSYRLRGSTYNGRNDKPQKHDTKTNYQEDEEFYDNSDYNYHQSSFEKEDDYSKGQRRASDSDEDVSTVLRFTKPIMMKYQTEHNIYKKHKKKAKDKLGSTEKWHIEKEEKKEKRHKNVKRNKKIGGNKKRTKENFHGKNNIVHKLYNGPKGRLINLFNNNSVTNKDKLKDKAKQAKGWVQSLKNDSKVGPKLNKLINESKVVKEWVENLNNETHIVNELIKLKNKTQGQKPWLLHLTNKTEYANKFENHSKGWVDKLRNTTLRDTFGKLYEYVKNKTEYVIKPLQVAWNESQKVKNDTNKLNLYTFLTKPTMITLPENSIAPILNPLEHNITQNLQLLKNETQIGLESLYNELNKVPHRIKDNFTISSFTKRILSRTLKLFDDMELRSTEYRWKKKMKHLAKSYEDKFTEFLRATKHHTIRTRLGARKVILNAIDVSNRIVKRLLDFMADDMDKKGLAYNNLTPLMFRTEISKEEDWELNRACNKLGICRTPKGFTDFIVDFMIMMLSLPNNRFKPAFSALIEAAKNTDFAFSTNTNEGIKRKLDYYDRQDVHVQKGMLMIVKNIIANRNSPLVLYKDTDPVKSKLQFTLAFLDIISTLDEKVPTNDNNLKDWNHLKRKMNSFVDGRKEDIQSTMSNFIVHCSNIMKDVDFPSWQIISRNAKILFS